MERYDEKPIDEPQGSSSSSSCSTRVKPPPKPPRTPRTARQRFNFAPASARDNIIFGAERPGHVPPNRTQPTTPRGTLVVDGQVLEWIEALKAKGIRRVMCLLLDEELSFYASDLMGLYRKHFTAAIHLSLSSKKALDQVMSHLYKAEEQNEPIAIHCSTGQVRTGTVLALWLHHRYHLSLDTAVEECADHARACGAMRKATVEGVLRLLMGPSQRALPSMRLAGGAISTPRVSDELHVTFLQMGGNIDKDVPTSMGGYAFEIGEAAVTRILRSVQRGFSHEVVNVCRKDSVDITQQDRVLLLDIINKVKTTKFIVTHGLDTMIETAQFVAQSVGMAERTIIFTGAQRPQKFVDSDAAFNVGSAVSAMNLLGTGCYICMNGRIIEASRCRRDGRTGKFVQI